VGMKQLALSTRSSSKGLREGKSKRQVRARPSCTSTATARASRLQPQRRTTRGVNEAVRSADRADAARTFGVVSRALEAYSADMIWTAATKRRANANVVELKINREARSNTARQSIRSSSSGVQVQADSDSITVALCTGSAQSGCRDRAVKIRRRAQIQDLLHICKRSGHTHAQSTRARKHKRLCQQRRTRRSSWQRR